jgi:hypothetical protein
MPQSTTDDPMNAGVKGSGDALSRLGQAVNNYLSGGGTPSTPAPQPTEPSPAAGPQEPNPSQPVVPQPAATPEGAQPPDQPPADNGALTRLQQQLAKTNRLLQSLGIDPDSDVPDQFAAGLIDANSLLSMVKPGVAVAGPQLTPAQPQAQQQNALAKMQEIREKAARGEAGPEDFAEFVDLTMQAEQERQRAAEMAATQALVDRCFSAATNVLRTDPVHVGQPEEIRQTENDLFLASTDFLINEARMRANADPAAFMTERHYSFYGQRNLQRLQALRNHYIEVGRQQALKGIQQKPGGQVPVPVSPAMGSGPIAPPPVRPTLDTLAARTKAYMQRQISTV